LAQIYGAIAFYLSNREEIDQYLKEVELEYERQRRKEREKETEFYARFDRLREEMKQENLLAK